MEYFSLVPNGNGGECVKLLSENMLQSSAVAAATAIQGFGAHGAVMRGFNGVNDDAEQAKIKVQSSS